jgi:hypothetical protein
MRRVSGRRRLRAWSRLEFTRKFSSSVSGTWTFVIRPNLRPLHRRGADARHEAVSSSTREINERSCRAHISAGRSDWIGSLLPPRTPKRYENAHTSFLAAAGTVSPKYDLSSENPR